MVFLQIQKASTFTELFYSKQRKERVIQELLEERDTLSHKLEKLKSKFRIKKYARKLGMIPVKLEQIKKINKLISNGNKV